MTLTVWIPAGTPAELRSAVPDGVVLCEVPPAGPLAEPARGEFLVAGFDPARTIEVMPQLHGLRVVQTLTAGVDTIAPHVPPGVVLCDGSGIHDAPVSEWVVMAILALRRGLPQHVVSQQQASWRWAGGGDDLEDCRVLILGYGSIGRAVEARIAPFGARVTRVASHARDGVHGTDELSLLLRHADAVVVLLPLTPRTRGMVDAAFLAAMPRGSLLVNAARGPIVETGALVEALSRGHIQAALDVTDPEPLPDGHPLWSAPGVLITPHIAGAVQRVYERGWRFAGEQIRRLLAGQPLHNVVSEGY